MCSSWNSNVETFTFEWTIENVVRTFRSFQNYFLYSPTFVTRASFVTKWRLTLQFNRDNETATSVYLERNGCSGPSEVFVYYGISLYTQEGQSFSTKTGHNVKFKFGSVVKIMDIERLSEMLNIKSVDGNLTLKCDVTFRFSEISAEILDALSLSKDFSTLLDTKQLADLKLHAGLRTFHVHRLILWARARSLARHFGISKDQTITPADVDVVDIDQDVLEELLYFLYSGKVRTQSCFMLMKLALIAKRFNISDLEGMLRSPVKKYIASTKLRTESISFLWSVQNFKSIEDYKEFQHDPISTSSLNCMLIFTIVKSCNHISINLRKFSLVPCSSQIWASIKIDVVGKNGILLHVVDDEHRMILAEDQRLPLVHQFQELLTTKGISSVLINDVLNLKLLLVLEDGKVNSEIQCTEILSECTSRENLLGLRDNLFDIHRQGFALSDVLLRVGSESFKAHRVILAARSPKFARYFQQEGTCNVVNIEDIDPSTLTSLLKYMYGWHSIHVDCDAAILYAYADRSEMSSLKNMCVECMSRDLSEETAVAIYSLAYDYSEEQLKCLVRDFICSHAKNILESEQWRVLTRTRSNLSLEILSLIDDRSRDSFPIVDLTST